MAEPDKTLNNPTTPPPTAEKPKEVRQRIPMAVPMRKLEVPNIEGYHSHWFLGENVPRALQGGYDHVLITEVPINQFNPATSADVSGSTGLGTLVEYTDGVDDRGKNRVLYLMKIPIELWLEDQKIIERRNANVLQTIFRSEQVIGTESMNAEDRELMYVDRDRQRANIPLFMRRPRKV